MTTLLRKLMVVVVIAGFVFAMPLVSSGTPTVYSDAGADATSIQAIVDSFRTALGGVNNGNAPGRLATGSVKSTGMAAVQQLPFPQRRSEGFETIAARSSPREEQGCYHPPDWEPLVITTPPTESRASTDGQGW